MVDESRERHEGERDEGGPLGLPIPRRGLFAALAIAAGNTAASALLPPPALAVGAVGQGFYTWGGGSDGGVMYNGRGVGYCNGWQADWQCSKYGGQSYQGLRLALGLEVTCDYCNELYTHAVARPLMACGDDNYQNTSRLWYPGGEDNRGAIFRSGQALSSGFQGDLLNIELGTGKGSNWNTGFKDYAYTTPTLFIRRGRERVNESWTAKVDISNVLVNTGNGSSRWYNFPEVYTTLWLGIDLHQTQDSIFIRNRGDLFGLIVEVRDAQQPDMLLDASGGRPATNGGVIIWHRYHTANQNWMVQPGAADEVGGIMHVLAVMNSKGLGLCLNEANGATPSTAHGNQIQLFPYDATRASEWWAHRHDDGSMYLFCDGTGRCLDRSNGGHTDGTVIQAYSSGFCDQWENLANRWNIVEVKFKGSIDLPSDPLRAGDEIECPDPRDLCTPRKYDEHADEGLDYIYRWYAHGEDGDVPETGIVMGQGHIANIGDADEAPAHGHVGLPHLGKAAATQGREDYGLESFRLALEGWDVPGGISYETDLGDSGADGSWCGPKGVSHKFGGVRIWLTGEAARYADLAYRVFRTGSGWSDTVYSTGQGSAPLAGGAWGGSGAVRGLWVMPVPKPLDAAVVREFSRDPSYKVDAAALEGLPFRPSRVCCAVMLSITGVDRGNERVFTDRYLGTVLSSSVPLQLTSKVTAYADGEVVGEFEYRNGEAPVVPSDIEAAARREGCTRWEGWFKDAACKEPWQPEPREGDFDIFSFNVVTIDFDTTDDSASVEGTFRKAPDPGAEAAVMVPDPIEGRWGREIRLSLPGTCFRDDGDGNWSTMRSEGYFTDSSASASPIKSVTPRRDATLYLRWRTSISDGVEAFR